jgi:hypothetical protein
MNVLSAPPGGPGDAGGRRGLVEPNADFPIGEAAEWSKRSVARLDRRRASVGAAWLPGASRFPILLASEFLNRLLDLSDELVLVPELLPE